MEECIISEEMTTVCWGIEKIFYLIALIAYIKMIFIHIQGFPFRFWYGYGPTPQAGLGGEVAVLISERV